MTLRLLATERVLQRWSEFQPHAELEETAARSCQNTGNAPEIGPAAEAVRTGEIGVIRQIEEIAAELEPKALGERPSLVHGEGGILDSQAMTDVAGRIAEDCD